MSLRTIRKMPDGHSIPEHLVSRSFEKHQLYTALCIIDGRTVTFPLSDIEPADEWKVWKEGV